MNKEVTDIVRDRYASGADACESNLCCAVDYDPKYLEVIPEEVIERDYGCGDPSRFVQEGETVLDLGSGTGKICFIASQLVGAEGKVIGVDMTDEMLAVAREAAPVVAERIGYGNVEFRRGKIQDLRTSLDAVDALLADRPVISAADYEALQGAIAEQGRTDPLVADDSVDLIVSNCVLNLVSDGEKRQLFEEMFRVLKKGGRIAIADIVSDEDSPDHLKNDPTLWSGCVSGAMTEHGFIQLLEEVGFYGMQIETYEPEPWQVVEGIEYRSVTVMAWKGKQGPCIEKNQAVIYRGPWKTVEDDDGHVFHRGQRMAVCEKTFDIMGREPYVEHVIPVPSALPVTTSDEFDCARPTVRSPEETKSGLPKMTSEPQSSCC
ncbi:MAG: methyltransferase domain-containing protein [Alphaproteobacteria bacterium]